jgi:formylglycine-generating enzyme required for sulfatase activity
MPELRKTSTTTPGDVYAARDVIIGDQINVMPAEQIEALLRRVIDLLKEQNAWLMPERHAKTLEPLMGIAGSSDALSVSTALLNRLSTLPRDPLHREHIYLMRFTLGETYARWDQDYLGLAGILLETSLRSSGRADKATPTDLNDIREALTYFDEPRLVILGEPGSGKTATLQRIALDMARDRLRDPLKHRLPFCVDLFNFIGSGLRPSEFLKSEWETSGLDVSYGEAAAQGQIGFLLDGLNQMPVADRAERTQLWAHWVNTALPPGNWAIFTGRASEYVTSLRIPEVHVQPLDRTRIRRYFDVRFGPEHDERHWRRFEKMLRSGDDQFEKLACNPFMLSLLAARRVPTRRAGESRANVMHDFVRSLLEHELEEGRQPSKMIHNPAVTIDTTLRILSRLAFAMQAKGKGTRLTYSSALQMGCDPKRPAQRFGAVRLSVDEAITLAVAAHVMEMSQIEGQDTTCAFYHHLMQEYVAALELLRRFRAGQNLEKYWRVPWALARFPMDWRRPGERLNSPPITGWEETVIMATGLAGNDAQPLIAAVAKANLPLAGRCLAALESERADLASLAGTIRAELLVRQRNPSAHLRMRIDAGLALGELGHPDLQASRFKRRGRIVMAIVPPLQMVPAGEFIRGSNRDDKRAFPDEYTTEWTLALPAFEIGRYPVTNAEYHLFIDDGGYQNDRWWSKTGLKWKQGSERMHLALVKEWLDFRNYLETQDLDQHARQMHWRAKTLRYWQDMIQMSDAEARAYARQAFKRPVDRPAYWDDPEFNSPAMPVVGVTWYEAEAYCNWLSHAARREFRLPTEAEWEKAARGIDGQEFPWKGRFTSQACNSVESHIYTTTPVDMYKNGVSPFGLYDVAGNVCEWTADWYQMYPGGEANVPGYGRKYRVVRGGSWYFNQSYARCAKRDKFVPVNYDIDLGFRLCATAK